MFVCSAVLSGVRLGKAPEDAGWRSGTLQRAARCHGPGAVWGSYSACVWHTHTHTQASVQTMTLPIKLKVNHLPTCAKENFHTWAPLWTPPYCRLLCVQLSHQSHPGGAVRQRAVGGRRRQRQTESVPPGRLPQHAGGFPGDASQRLWHQRPQGEGRHHTHTHVHTSTTVVALECLCSLSLAPCRITSTAEWHRSLVHQGGGEKHRHRVSSHRRSDSWRTLPGAHQRHAGFRFD